MWKHELLCIVGNKRKKNEQEKDFGKKNVENNMHVSALLEAMRFLAGAQHENREMMFLRVRQRV